MLRSAPKKLHCSLQGDRGFSVLEAVIAAAIVSTALWVGLDITATDTFQIQEQLSCKVRLELFDESKATSTERTSRTCLR